MFQSPPTSKSYIPIIINISLNIWKNKSHVPTSKLYISKWCFNGNIQNVGGFSITVGFPSLPETHFESIPPRECCLHVARPREPGNIRERVVLQGQTWRRTWMKSHYIYIHMYIVYIYYMYIYVSYIYMYMYHIYIYG